MDNLCPILFALDRLHYSRWLPVVVDDLKLLKLTDLDLFSKFSSGSFVVRKTDAEFSCMASDQAHEQTNRLIKSKAGLADVLNKEDTRYLCRLENIIVG